MTSAIGVFEFATPENFCAPGYLLANRDVLIALGGDEAMAERHLHEYGLKENRRQLSMAFLASRREKFARFRATLPECNAECFPVNFGNSLHSISDYGAESSNELPSFWVAELEENPNKLYADIGAGLRPTVWPNCAYLEVYPSLTADILIDPHCKLPFKDAALDGIACFAVLEHVNKPWEMAAEFSRVVKPGGKIFIDWPFLQPVHGFPSHYFNATREGLRSLFADNFEIEELFTGHWEGPDYTVSWVLNSLLSSIKDDLVRTGFLKTTIGEVCGQSPESEFWRTILSKMDDSAISMLACGNHLIARRMPLSRNNYYEERQRLLQAVSQESSRNAAPLEPRPATTAPAPQPPLFDPAPLYDEIAELQRQIEVRQEELDVAEAKVQELKNTLKALRREADNHKSLADTAGERLTATLNSTSWRITAPLRRIATAVRGR